MENKTIEELCQAEDMLEAIEEQAKFEAKRFIQRLEWSLIAAIWMAVIVLFLRVG